MGVLTPDPKHKWHPDKKLPSMEAFYQFGLKQIALYYRQQLPPCSAPQYLYYSRYSHMYDLESAALPGSCNT